VGAVAIVCSTSQAVVWRAEQEWLRDAQGHRRGGQGHFVCVVGGAVAGMVAVCGCMIQTEGAVGTIMQGVEARAVLVVVVAVIRCSGGRWGCGRSGV
jgi:hypothetical protein